MSTSPVWMRRFANVKITLCKIIKKLPYQKQGIFLQFRGGNPTRCDKPYPCGGGLLFDRFCFLVLDKESPSQE